DMLESHRQLMKRQAMTAGDPFHAEGSREGVGDSTDRLPVLDPMEGQDGQQREGREEPPTLVACRNPISVSIGCEPRIGPFPANGAEKLPQASGDGFGIAPSKQGVAPIP